MVSVICPTYNRFKILLDAIESFKQQDYPDKELIIVNDGSTGQDALNMGALKKQYENTNIKVFNRLNRGQAAAQNFGIAASTGELICTLDDDDLLYPNTSLSSRVDIFHRYPTYEFIWTSAMEGPMGSNKGTIRHCYQKSYMDEWRKDDIYINSIMFRKNILEKIGKYYFDPELSSNEDWDFKIRCMMNCVCDCADMVTTWHRQHADMRSTIHRRTGELDANAKKFREKLLKVYGDKLK